MSAPGSETAENCVICLDPISERAVASPCQHAFDYLCLLSWLEVRQSCPLCNTAVNALSVTDKTLGKAVKHPVDPPSAHRRRTRTPPPHRTPTALLRRRYIYTHNLRSHHIGSNPTSRFRPPPTPRQLRHTPPLLSRARTFLRRELQVFPWLAPNREYLLEYVVAILKSVDLRGASGAAEDMVADFLGRGNARVFLHELGAWLRSPFDRLVDFDRFVQYARAVPEAFSAEEEAAVALVGGGGEGGAAPPSPGSNGVRSAGKGPGGRGYDSYRPRYPRA